MLTVKAQYTSEHVRSHLEGEIGLGMVPIMDDNKCWFAAIDIDTHGPNGQSIDLQVIESRVTKLNLPLIVCRSKSGGAHCYLFLKELTEAAQVRLVLGRWANAIGYPSAEIFPKQNDLNEKGGEKPLGNWINLPYFVAEGTERWCVEGGKPTTFEYFIDLAEGRRVDLAPYTQEGMETVYASGPPCLQEMLKNKIDEGNRNTAMFQAGVFLKRAFPEEFRPRMDEFNTTAFVSPLSTRELRVIAVSVGKKEYQYKCREEPCKSLCNKDLCKTRPFGITDNDSSANDIPLIESVEKVITTPIHWVLTVKGKRVQVTTAELFNYESVRQKVGEALHIILPRIKNQDWDQYLREIMDKVKVREDTTIEDTYFLKLCEYLRRVQKDKTRPEDERRLDLKRGVPSLISISKMSFDASGPKEQGRVWYYAFRIVDFVEHLRRKKSLTVPDYQVPGILYRLLGEYGKREKVRIGDTYVRNVWCVPEESVEEETVPSKLFDTEF